MNEQLAHVELDFNDIFDVWLPPWWESPWIWGLIIIGGATVIAGVYTLVAYYKRYKNRKNPVDVVLQRIAAARKIAEASHGPMHDGEQMKQAYVALIEAIKEYLEAEYSCAIMSKTEQELLEYFDIQQNLAKDSELIAWRAYIAARVEPGREVKFGRCIVDPAHIVYECDIVQKLVIKTSQRQKRA